MKTAQDLVMTAKAQIQEIPVSEATAAIQSADVLIDVREAEEYASGHIPGAVHMSRGMLEFKIGATPELGDRSKSIVLYCKTSGRAALAAQSLKAMGYLNVRSIAGGIDAWSASGLPVAKPNVPDFG